MQVYYFTRTQKSRRIAEKLALKYNGKPAVIEDGRDWSGKRHFLQAGAMAAKHKKITITYSPVLNDTTIILVFPVWAGSLPPAIRQFVEEQAHCNIIAVAVSAISRLSNADQQLFVKSYEVKGRSEEVPEIV